MRRLIITILLGCLAQVVMANEGKSISDQLICNSKKDSIVTTKYITKLQFFKPSIVIDKNQVEVKLFNNLYTQTQFFDNQRRRTNLNTRSTYYTGILQLLYGITNKINLGFHLFFRSVRIDSEEAFPLTVFRFENNNIARTTLSGIGPTIRIAPFKNNNHLSIQSCILIPASSDMEGRINGKPFLDYDKITWWTQIFYDKVLPRNFIVFSEVDILWRLDKRFDLYQSILTTPLKVFAGKLIGKKWAGYAMTEWSPFWGTSIIDAHYLQTGAGLKYMIFNNLELEILYTKFIYGMNSGAGETYNIGLRFLK
ncbi:hypothetical protein JYT53_00645 [Cytophagaceae bacterium AH-315-L13]|nr:hypothetical protein [Cytophagaceae bacterium AH-315-L13]